MYSRRYMPAVNRCPTHDATEHTGAETRAEARAPGAFMHSTCLLALTTCTAVTTSLLYCYNLSFNLNLHVLTYSPQDRNHVLLQQHH